MWRQLLHKFGDQATVYNSIQHAVGSERVWNGFIESLHNRLSTWNSTGVWLDLGCGTADILAHLPTNIPYIGVDINPKYIDYAQKTYPHRPNTTFVCASWHDTAWLDKIDGLHISVVSLLGLLHHLNDDEARKLLQLSFTCLSPQGTLISLDGCKEIHASMIERFFYWIDRGQHVRSSASLASLFPIKPQVSLHHKWLHVPYCYGICRIEKA